MYFCCCSNFSKDSFQDVAFMVGRLPLLLNSAYLLPNAVRTFSVFSGWADMIRTANFTLSDILQLDFSKWSKYSSDRLMYLLSITALIIIPYDAVAFILVSSDTIWRITLFSIVENVGELNNVSKQWGKVTDDYLKRCNITRFCQAKEYVFSYNDNFSF